MFKSRFLPVKILSATEASVHTDDAVYPWSLLKQAHEHLTGTPNANVLIQNNNICFASHPDIRWFLCDVVNAYEYFTLAQQNKFSFYPIYNKSGVVVLYVSSIFNQSRLIVDAYTMNTVIVTKDKLVRKLSCMVDQRYPTKHLMHLFHYACQLEKGSRAFLDGWICYPDSEDGYINVNPLTALYADTTVWYSFDNLAEIEKLVTGECTETESYTIENNQIARKDIESYPVMSMDWCTNVVNLWHKLAARNRSFTPINSEEDWLPLCYCSTDLHHVVDADTGECVNVKNKSLKETLRKCLSNGTISKQDYVVLWDCLRTRDR